MRLRSTCRARATGRTMPFERIGWVRFAIDGSPCRLSVFWLNDYAGGIFIPFRDTTSGKETYGGGRYLWDSAKGADLGTDRRRADPRLQLRLPPVVRVRPGLVVPAGAPGELAPDPDPRRRAPAAAAPGPMTTPAEGRHCIKCGREIGPDESICDVCNRAGMATPSASQYHGTVVVAIVLAVAGLAVAASLSLRGVGPYGAEVRGFAPADPIGYVDHLRRHERGNEGGTGEVPARRARRGRPPASDARHRHRADRGRLDRRADRGHPGPGRRAGDGERQLLLALQDEAHLDEALLERRVGHERPRGMREVDDALVIGPPVALAPVDDRQADASIRADGDVAVDLSGVAAAEVARAARPLPGRSIPPCPA